MTGPVCKLQSKGSPAFGTQTGASKAIADRRLRRRCADIAEAFADKEVRVRHITQRFWLAG
jgi:hypothetical protein